MFFPWFWDLCCWLNSKGIGIAGLASLTSLAMIGPLFSVVILGHLFPRNIVLPFGVCCLTFSGLMYCDFFRNPFRTRGNASFHQKS